MPLKRMSKIRLLLVAISIVAVQSAIASVSQDSLGVNKDTNTETSNTLGYQRGEPVW